MWLGRRDFCISLVPKAVRRRPESKAPGRDRAQDSRIEGTQRGGARTEPYVIAARAVAPNSVAPTEAVTSDTSANAISSFIAFILNNEHMYNLRRAMPPVRYIGYTSRLTPG